MIKFDTEYEEIAAREMLAFEPDTRPVDVGEAWERSAEGRIHAVADRIREADRIGARRAEVERKVRAHQNAMDAPMECANCGEDGYIAEECMHFSCPHCGLNEEDEAVSEPRRPTRRVVDPEVMNSPQRCPNCDEMGLLSDDGTYFTCPHCTYEIDN